MTIEKFELTDIERANIEHMFALAQLNWQKKLCIEIERLLDEARQYMCSALARYSKAEQGLKMAEKDYQESLRGSLNEKI